MMLIMVLLHLLEVLDERSTMMDINMGHIIADISNDESYNNNSSHISKEKRGQNWEDDRIDNQGQGRREDQSIGVHRDGVVDTVDHEMGPQGPRTIGKRVIKVEDNSMERVFSETPDKDSEEEGHYDI